MNLKEIRLQNKKTVKDVAEKLGVSPQAVSNYESGIRDINVEQFFDLCEIYGETADELMEAYRETRESRNPKP